MQVDAGMQLLHARLGAAGDARFRVGPGHEDPDPAAPVILSERVTRSRGYADEEELVRFIKAANGGVVSAAGTLVVDLDGPKTGYRWTLRRVVISDAAAWANSMGAAVAQVYAGQSSLVQVPHNVEWAFSVLPNVANFSSEQTVLQYGEHLFVAVTGGTSGQGLVVGVSYQLYADRPGVGQLEV
jgi:hypothetical protein